MLHKELDADDGELTRTQKVRRGFIAERYAPLVDGALRRRRPRPTSATEVTFEDGRKGVIAARVKIRDVQIYPVAAPRPWRRRNEAPGPDTASWPATCCSRSRTCRCRSAA